MKKVLLTFVLSFIFFDAQALHEDFKLEKNKTELINLYKNYLNSLSSDLDALVGFKKLLKPSVLKKIIPHLDIELSLSEIKNTYKKTGFIQLRKIDPELQTLIIGCGNRPFCHGGWNTVTCNEKYRNQHIHEGSITIDPDLRKNPTIVAYFGTKKLKNIAHNSFNKVLVENIAFPDLLELKYFDSDLKRVLIKDGKLNVLFGEDDPIEIDINKLGEYGKKWDLIVAKTEKGKMH